MLTGCIIRQYIHRLNNEATNKQQTHNEQNLLTNFLNYYTIDSLAQ